MNKIESLPGKYCFFQMSKRQRKCSHGRRQSRCVPCGGKEMCEHKRLRARCVPCGGSQTCEHKRLRAQCKDCGGTRICEHQKLRPYCKKCGGSQICGHGINKGICKRCKGNQICEHNRIRTQCRDCGGGSICEHGRRRCKCKKCGGSQICEHGINKDICKKCGGSQICGHNRIRSQCKDCEGGSICEHRRIRSHCASCRGSSICRHNKQKYHCIKCTPSRGCQLCHHIYVGPRSRYKPYCFNCYCYLHPDEEIPRRYKIKENHLRDYLVKEFPDIKLVFDKKVKGGCSLRRPDVRLECFTHTIIIECDENRHKGYTCESKRIMQLFQDLGNRPLVVLRFNPDKNDSSEGCFKKTKAGSLSLNKKEWTHRLTGLAKRMQHYRSNLPKKELTVEHLFY